LKESNHRDLLWIFHLFFNTKVNVLLWPNGCKKSLFMADLQIKRVPLLS